MKVLVIGVNGGDFLDDILRISPNNLMGLKHIKLKPNDSKMVTGHNLSQISDNCIVSGLCDVYIDAKHKSLSSPSGYILKMIEYIETLSQSFDIVVFISDNNILTHKGKVNEDYRSKLASIAISNNTSQYLSNITPAQLISKINDNLSNL